MEFHVPTWSWTAPDDPAERIDRTLIDRGHRLMAGISVGRRFDRVDAALLVGVGHGKYLRVKHAEGQSQSIPRPLADALRALVLQPQPTVAELKQLTADLAIVQASLFEQVKCRAGKYVDRVLAIAVSDPGLWWRDFDGSAQYAGLCDPDRLSQLTGVTVIDDFPAADVASGGSGRCLSALPHWLHRADRVNGIAAAHRLVIQFSADAAGYWLPASDGLDADVPRIRTITSTPGVEFLDAVLGLREGTLEQSSAIEKSSDARGDGRDPSGVGVGELARDVSSRENHAQLEKFYAQGNRSDELIKAWQNQWEHFLGRDDSPAASVAKSSGSDAVDTSRDAQRRAVIDRLIRITRQQPMVELPWPDVLRSAVVWLTQLVVDSVSPVHARVDEVWFGADTPLNHCLINQFIQASGLPGSRVNVTGAANTGTPCSQRPSSSPFGRPGFEAASASQCQTAAPVTTAILGFLHIDQMPASVPSLTGAREHRTLGRLTPGKPSNWRQLLREMADFHPPAMKLRDAV